MDECRVRWLGRVHTVHTVCRRFHFSSLRAVGGNQKNKEWTVDHSINVEVWLGIDIDDALDTANIKPLFNLLIKNLFCKNQMYIKTTKL